MDQEFCGESHAVDSLAKISQAFVIIELCVDAIDGRRQAELTACEHQVAAQLPDELGIVGPDRHDAEVDCEIPRSDGESLDLAGFDHPGQCIEACGGFDDRQNSSRSRVDQGSDAFAAFRFRQNRAVDVLPGDRLQVGGKNRIVGVDAYPDLRTDGLRLMRSKVGRKMLACFLFHVVCDAVFEIKDHSIGIGLHRFRDLAVFGARYEEVCNRKHVIPCPSQRERDFLMLYFGTLPRLYTMKVRLNSMTTLSC